MSTVELRAAILMPSPFINRWAGQGCRAAKRPRCRAYKAISWPGTPRASQDTATAGARMPSEPATPFDARPLAASVPGRQARARGLEAVLPLSEGGEDHGRRGAAGASGLDISALRAQEGVDLPLSCHRRRDRELALHCLSHGPLQPLLQIFVRRLLSLSKLQVFHRVLVPDVHLGFHRQSAQFVGTGVVQVLWRALEDPAAAADEQRVSRENGLGFPARAVVAHGTPRVAWSVDRPDLDGTKAQLCTVVQRMRASLDCVQAAAVDVQAGDFRSQLAIASCVVPVLVRGQDAHDV